VAKILTVLRGSVGLDNKTDPLRIAYDPEKGIGFLSIAYNVNISNSLRVSRVKGYTKRRSEAVTSFYADGDRAFYVSLDKLYELKEDYSRITLRTGLTLNARMSFVEVFGKYYYTNGYENGVIENEGSWTWVKGDYVGATTDKSFSNPPIGHLLECYKGRLYIAKDNVLYPSERRDYGRFQLKLGTPFPDKIRMLKAVDDGLYVGTSKCVYSLRGNTFKEFNIQKVIIDTVVKGSDVIMNGQYLQGGSLFQGKVIIWTGYKGIYAGGSNGKVVNLTYEHLRYPKAEEGAGIIIDDRYVCLLFS